MKKPTPTTNKLKTNQKQMMKKMFILLIFFFFLSNVITVFSLLSIYLLQLSSPRANLLVERIQIKKKNQWKT